MLEIVVAAPREVLDLEPEAVVALRQHFQYLETGGDHLDADAVTGNGCNSVFTHSCLAQ